MTPSAPRAPPDIGCQRRPPAQPLDQIDCNLTERARFWSWAGLAGGGDTSGRASLAASERAAKDNTTRAGSASGRRYVAGGRPHSSGLAAADARRRRAM